MGESSNQMESTKHLEMGHPGWAWYRARETKDGETKDGETKDYWVHLPLPRVETFWQLDRFLAIWSRELRAHLETTRSDADDKQWRRKVALGWTKAGWIVEKDSERRYRAYVSRKQVADDGNGEFAAYMALLNSWDKKKNDKRDRCVRDVFGDGSVLLNWVAGSQE